MQFTPKSEAEIRAEGLLPDAVYDFEVLSAEDRVSKAGNEMIALQLKVFAEDGSPRTVRDWIVSNQHRKLHGFCESVGLLEAYNAGQVEAAMLTGSAGRVKVVIENSDQYGPGNKVAYYAAPKAGAAPAPKKFGAPKPAEPAYPAPSKKPGSGGVLLDDEIPFAPEWR